MIKTFEQFTNKANGIDIHSASFKSWFGDWERNPEHSSKVVDENGVPQVVLHLTNEEWEEYQELPEFDEEDPLEYSFIWGYIPGENEKRFPAWSKSSIEVEFYFNLRNPLIIDAEGRDSDDIPGKKFGLPYDHESAFGIAIQARKKGYDGVIIKNVCDVTSTPSTDVIAFYNNQVKRIKRGH